MLAQPTPQETNATNPQGETTALLTRFNFPLPKKGSILDGEVLSVSLLNVLIDLGPFGTAVVYPKEFYEDPEKQKALKPGQRVKAVLLNIENEEGLRELSLRKAQLKSAWQEIKEMYGKGEVIPVRIMNLNKGGLIAEISGVQAFMPLSQLAEEHYPKVENGNIQEIVRILQAFRNQEFQVKIIDVDEAENKLIISEKAAKQALEKEKASHHSVGEAVEGEIIETTDFGAFVRLNDGTDALLPKSEMDPGRSREGSQRASASYGVDEDTKPKIGDKVKGVIIEVSPDKTVISSKARESETK